MFIDRYGGIFETSNPAREYTLDDFVTLNLEKLDRFVHLRGTGLDELEWRGSDDEGSDGDSDDDGEDGEDTEDEDGEDEVEGEMEALEEGEESEDAKEKRHAALSQAEKVSCAILPIFTSDSKLTRRMHYVVELHSTWAYRNQPPGQRKTFSRRHSQARTSGHSSIVPGNSGQLAHMRNQAVGARPSGEKGSVSTPLVLIAYFPIRIYPVEF